MSRLVATFGRQALPMVWDFAETNPLAGAGGDLSVACVLYVRFWRGSSAQQYPVDSRQVDAVEQGDSVGRIVSTDPRTTTTSPTLTSQTSFMCGSGAACVLSSPICSPLRPCPSVQNWSRRPNATEGDARQKSFFVGNVPCD